MRRSVGKYVGSFAPAPPICGLISLHAELESEGSREVDEVMEDTLSGMVVVASVAAGLNPTGSVPPVNWFMVSGLLWLLLTSPSNFMKDDRCLSLLYM